MKETFQIQEFEPVWANKRTINVQTVDYFSDKQTGQANSIHISINEARHLIAEK